MLKLRTQRTVAKRSLSAMITVLSVVCLGSCIDPNIEAILLPDLQYYLEYQATSQKQNRLQLFTSYPDLSIELIPDDDSSVKSNVAFRKRIPVTRLIEFEFNEERHYFVDLRVYLKDGTLYQVDQLSWTFSTTAPPEPLVAFNNQASNSESVFLYISSSRGAETTEIWIEGDLAPAEYPEGRWRNIPNSGVIPLTTSAGEGLKIFKVKTRNIFGIESVEKTISILIKKTKPSHCSVTTVDSKSASRQAIVRIEAQDSGPVYYRVYGDTINSRSFKEFANLIEESIVFTPEKGRKSLTFQIRDQAGNYCLEETLEFDYDPEYNPAKVTILDRKYWTDENEIEVQLDYPHFSDKQVEYYVYGGATGEGTQSWLPLQDRITLTLAPYEGQRWVRVRFRENGVNKAEALDGIYLRPTIRVQGSQAPYLVRVSNMAGLSSLSIRGCEESYNNTAHKNGFSCHPIDSTISVDYVFEDGSTLTRSVDL